MPINASLFAHIQNDAFLAGTVGLEGNFFSKTASYLHRYLLTNPHESNQAYIELITELDYLIAIEQAVTRTELSPASAAATLNQLAQKIIEDLERTPLGKSLLFPGGWVTTTGGHAMIYQLERVADSYLFLVVNSGDGIHYHAKQSSTEKELYNPIKAWSIPTPGSEKIKRELIQFISRLLKAQTLCAQTKAIDSGVLYKEVLQTISYVNGIEVDASAYCPTFAYTSGQLSATCTQRILHQMMKIKSRSLEEYRRFIFNFKMHALIEYSDLCFRYAEPFNSAVAEQINHAVENNLKILNTAELLHSLENQKHRQTLTTIQARIKNRIHLQSVIQIQVPYPKPQCVAIQSTSPKIPTHKISYELPPTFEIELTDQNFLTKLIHFVAAIKSTREPGIKYLHLERLLLSLPISKDGLLTSSPYRELVDKNAYSTFYTEIEHIQAIIQNLQSNWSACHINRLIVLSLSVLNCCQCLAVLLIF